MPEVVLGFIIYPTFLLPDVSCPLGQADVSAAEVRTMITCSHVPCIYLELRIRADWSTEKADVYHTWCRRFYLFIYLSSIMRCICIQMV